MANQRQHDRKPPQPAGRKPQAPEAEGPEQSHPILAMQRQVGNAQVARMLQRQPEVGLEGGPVSSELAGQINASRGRGAPLPEQTRSQMEGQFGTSFDDVRVHSDSTSHDLAQRISAQAFTTGSDIFLGKGASPNDAGLLGHELTHVVQQRQMDTSGPMTVGPANDAFEQEAASVAKSVKK